MIQVMNSEVTGVFKILNMVFPLGERLLSKTLVDSLPGGSDRY